MRSVGAGTLAHPTISAALSPIAYFEMFFIVSLCWSLSDYRQRTSRVCTLARTPLFALAPCKAQQPLHIRRANLHDAFTGESPMFNITRFNPIDDAFDNLVRGIPVWLPNLERREAAPAPFRMDVSENEREYQVLAEMPGLKKDEISITINGNEVSVSAELKHE